MRPHHFLVCIALAAVLMFPSTSRAQAVAVPTAAEEVVTLDAAALAEASSLHARQRDGLLVLLALVMAAGFVMHWSGTRRILRLESVSLSDPLTGVKNRRYLEQLVELDVAASVRSHRTAVKMKVPPKHADLVFMVIDLDNFKNINDHHGHAAGDRALRAIAQSLQQTCRDSDLLVRWGGDEFLVVQRFTDRADAAVGAERFRRAVEQTSIRIGGARAETVTCSVGYAAFPFRLDQPEAVTWDQVITLADLAAYSAKRDGRNESVGYVWNGVTGMQPADLAGLTDPHMMLRLSAVRRETAAPRPLLALEPNRPAAESVQQDARPRASRQTQPRMRLNLG